MSKVAKSGLKFVKKRVAGHKRSAEEIEEEAYERELAIQAAREAGLASNVHPSHQVQTVLPSKDEGDDDSGAQSAAQPQDPAVKKSSEDWELFNKLLGKVETAVASTVQNIEKVKESSVVKEIIAKEQKEAIVIPEYKGVKSLEEAKREKEEREREALRQRRDADEWERAFEASAKKQTPDLLCLDASSASAASDGGDPKLSFAYYSPSSGPSAIPKTPLEVDPFDTSFISPAVQGSESAVKADEDDPFDTKKIDEGIEEVSQLTQKRMSLSGGVNPFGGAPSGSGVQDDPNPRVRPPSRPTAGSSLFSSTECSPVDIPDDVQNFFKNASRRSSTNPFDPPALAAPQPLSTEDTIRTGAALLQAIACEFTDKDDDDDLFHRTLTSKGGLPPPSPMSPFSEPDAATDQAVPELMDMLLAPADAKASNVVSSSSDTILNPTNTLTTVSSAFNPTAASVDPFTDQMSVGGSSGGVPVIPLAPSAAPVPAAPGGSSAPVDAFQLAFGKKSIDLDDVPPQAQAELPPHEVPQALQSVKDSFDPFKGVQKGLELPTTNVPGPVSGAPTPGSDVFENELRQQEEELFGSNNGNRKAPGPPTPPGQQTTPHIPSPPLNNPSNNSDTSAGRAQPQRPPPPPAAFTEERRQSATRSSITKEDCLAGLKRASITSNNSNNGKGDKNPFSPKNSEHGSPCSPENPFASQAQRKDTTPPDNPFGNTAGPKPASPENPFGSSVAKKKSISSPENPFSSDTTTSGPTARGVTDTAASLPQTQTVFSRKASQDSNPFSPTATLPPINVGVNNPFGGDDEEPTGVSFSSAFASSATFATSETKAESTPFTFTNSSADPFDTENIVPATDQNALDAFASKFDSTNDGGTGAALDPFGGLGGGDAADVTGGFGGESFQHDSMDYLSESVIPTTQVPDNTPVKKANLGESKDSFDSDEEEEHMRVTIKPKLRPVANLGGADEFLPSLAAPIKLLPPPKSPSRQAGYQVQPDRFNPFDKGSMKTAKTADDELFNAFEDALLSEGPEGKDGKDDGRPPPALGESGAKQAAPLSPSTPLYDDDISQPLSEWRPKVEGVEGWDFFLRWPNKKKFTGNRYWKPVHVKFADTTILWVMNKKDDSDPIQEVPLQGCYSLSEMTHQQFDQFKKIFTIKLQYTFYKETVGVRKGQIAKVMSGQVNSMGSVAKLGLPLQHAPQLTQLLKLGTSDIESIRTFVRVIEDVLFGLQIHRDRALTYKSEEIQAMVVDEYVVEVDKVGHVCSQKARVRLFFLAFVNGMPDVEVGINELTRQGKEIVGRHDIMPIVTEEWIRVEDCEFHSCVERQEFEENKVIKLRPPDATFFELMRFRVRPPRQRELPIQLTAVLRVSPPKVQLKAEVLVPGYSSRKHGQIPCEDIAMFFPIPECWVYLFRVEKHFRYGALKSSNRRHGKIKGLERIMGAAAGGNIEKQLIEVTAGQAKYEPAHKCIVWRVPRLPKEGQGAYTQQMMTVDLELTSFDQIPTEFNSQLRVEFTMPASTVSHTTVRSISCPTDADLPVEKYCRYVAKHEYTVEMDVQMGTAPLEATPPSGVTRVEAREPQVPPTPPPPVRQTDSPASDSDDSD